MGYTFFSCNALVPLFVFVVHSGASAESPDSTGGAEKSRKAQSGCM